MNWISDNVLLTRIVNKPVFDKYKRIIKERYNGISFHIESGIIRFYRIQGKKCKLIYRFIYDRNLYFDDRIDKLKYWMIDKEEAKFLDMQCKKCLCFLRKENSYFHELKHKKDERNIRWRIYILLVFQRLDIPKDLAKYTIKLVIPKMKFFQR